jgi:hypothetical protein
MTPRQRWLAALDCQPADRIPFWPKLDASYIPAQEEPFRSMDLPQLHAWIGSDEIRGLGRALRPVFPPGYGFTEQVRDAVERLDTFITPGGNLERVCHWDQPSRSWHPVRFPVRDRDDILRLRDWHAHQSWEFDPAKFVTLEAQFRRHGDQIGYSVNQSQSPLMAWVEWFAGVENAHYFLADYPDEVVDLFVAMHEQLKARLRLIVAQQPSDFVWLFENTSTTLISVDQYRTLNAPHIAEYARICRAGGQRLVLHMCGKLKGILPELSAIPAAGFEAFTAPTLGDTTLRDGRLACPDKCLIGGTHAMLWLEPADKIIAQIKAWLDELPHHRGIVLTSAGVMTPRCKPQTIREVCAWLKTYPARM